jgi:hypothetical protein
MHRTTILAIILLAACSGALPAATILYDVKMNTSPLIGHPAGPFTLSFQLTDGAGTGDGNNSISLTNFQFGGGSAVAPPIASPGASGSLASGVTLTDTAFLVTFDQMFNPGATLSFLLGLTNNVDAGPTPDQFSFLVLDSSGSALPTASLASLGADVFLTADLASASPTVRTFASDPFRFPSTGNAITIAAPTATLADAAVPEPSTLGAAFTGLVLIAGASIGRARRKRTGQ